MEGIDRARARRVIKAVAVGLVLLAAAVAVRVPWASTVGLESDMRFFQRWASTGAELRRSGNGIGRIYTRRPDCNYPPLYPILLSYLPELDGWWHGDSGWEIPRVTERGKRHVSPHFRMRNHLASLAPILKAPAMAADLAIVLLIFCWTWARADPLRATVAAGLWALNPLAVYNSSYFGQIDAIHSFWMLAALLAALDRRVVLAWCLVALALLTKLQSIVIVPVVALLTVQPVIEAVRCADAKAVRRRLRALLLAAAAAAAVTWLILAPFARAGSLHQVGRVYAGSVSDKSHARVTVIAYNFWWLTLDVPKRSTAPSDRRLLAGPITARHIGYALFTMLAAIACAAAAMGGGRCSAMLAAPTVALAFFLVSTQMKARYGFASLVLMLPLLACGWRYAFVVVAVTATFLLNSARVLRLPADFFGLTQLVNSTTEWPWTGHTVAAVNLALLGYLFVELYCCARRERRQRRVPATADQLGA